MATWQRFADEAPQLAAAVRARFEASQHHVLATIRRDGSPRASGTEVTFSGPDLTIGSMLNAVKARDLIRDGRFALHANPGDGSMEGGDAKVAGVATEDQSSGPSHLFRLDLTEVVLTSVAHDRLVIDLWRTSRPVTRYERS